MTFIPGPGFMFWSCLPCMSAVLVGKWWDSSVGVRFYPVPGLMYLCRLFNKLLIVQSFQLLLWWKSLAKQCIPSFPPSPPVQSVPMKVIMRVVFSWLSRLAFWQTGVLPSIPNHWLDLSLIQLKRLTQGNWYRRSTSLWLDCLHFLCADCRPRSV